MKQRGTILPIAENDDGSVGLAVPGIIHDPIAAFGRLWGSGGYHPGENDEQGVRDAATVAGGMFAGGMARAAAAKGAAELGATGGAILARRDAQKLMMELRQAGHSDKKIAEALTERFAPELDEGASITKGMVVGKRQRSGDFELGATGGAGSGRVTASDVKAILDDLGLAATASTSSTGTTYFRASDPALGPDKSVKVRVPSASDPHGGAARPWQIDTSVEGTKHVHRGQANLAGEPYDSNLPALKDRLKYVFGKDGKGEMQVEPLKPAEADPKQLKLLAGGAPLPGPRDPADDSSVQDWMAGTVQPQRYGPEFEETLRGIDALDPGYHPGERMSDNVIDLRKPRSLWVEMRDQMTGKDQY